MSGIFLGSIILFQLTVVQRMVQNGPLETHSQHLGSETYIAMLESSERDSYQKPEEVLAALNLGAGEVVSDIGAGSGYFSFRLAREVGNSGKVYAVDINPERVLHINRRIRDEGVHNVITILADPDDPLLHEDSVDRVFICNTWHHIEKQEHYLSLLRRSLRPQGQIIMIDFKKKELPVGPPLEMKIAKSDLIVQMQKAGFVLQQEYHFLPYQYFLVFQSSPE